MRISEVARAAGCSVRAVRHYHASGALPEPPRTAAGYRDYRMSDLAALLRVRILVEAGVSLADIRSGSPSLLDTALDRLDTQLAELRARRERLLALQAGELGLPADIRSRILDVLGATDHARREIDALDFMGLSGVATPETWSVIRGNLTDPARRAEMRQAQEHWDALAGLSPHSPEADQIIRELHSGVGGGLMHGSAGTLIPGETGLSLQDLDVHGAQLRAIAELSGSPELA